MEPSYPGNANETPSYPQSGTPESPKRRWPLSRQLMLITAGAAVIVLLIVGAIVLDKGMSSGKQSDSGDSASLYIKRPGYETVNDSVGDPLALSSKPTDKVVQYGGASVVQPCALVTLKDVREAGLKTLANPLTDALRVVYFDGKGPGQLPAPSDLFLPFSDDTNRCAYSLEDKGLVEVSVFQPAYVSASAIGYEVSRNFSPTAAIEGLTAYVQKPNAANPEESTYILKASGVISRITIRTTDAAAKDKLLKLFAQRLNSAAATPTPVQQFTYDSPIFKGSVANACELTDNTSFKSVLGVDSGPLVEQSLGTAVGVIQEAQQSEKRHNYVVTECTRRSPEGSSRDKTVRVRIESYETVEGASALFGYGKTSPFTKNLQEITPTVGDESYFADTAGMQNAFVFRKGRFIVSIAYFLPQGNDAVTPAQRIQATTSLANSLAKDKLKE